MSKDGRMPAKLVREICALRDIEFRRTGAIIRSEINEQIVRAAKEKAGKITTIIPSMVIGQDPYNRLEMAKFIFKGLKEDGYCITGTYLQPTISWENEPELYKNVDRPVFYMIKDNSKN